MPKARAPKAPWVLVWLSPQTMVLPGWVRPCSGPMTCTMPGLGRVDVGQVDAELAAVLAQGVDLLRGDGVENVEALGRGGGHVVIDGAEGEIGTAHLAAGQAQALEGLGRGHLMHQVQIDVEKSGLRLFVPDDVGSPTAYRTGCGVLRKRMA